MKVQAIQGWKTSVDEILTGTVLKDYGRYYLVQFPKYKECIFKEEVICYLKED